MSISRLRGPIRDETLVGLDRAVSRHGIGPIGGGDGSRIRALQEYISFLASIITVARRQCRAVACEGRKVALRRDLEV